MSTVYSCIIICLCICKSIYGYLCMCMYSAGRPKSNRRSTYFLTFWLLLVVAVSIVSGVIQVRVFFENIRAGDGDSSTFHTAALIKVQFPTHSCVTCWFYFYYHNNTFFFLNNVNFPVTVEEKLASRKM